MQQSALMIDLETMDTKPSAAILSIGAVHFDPFGDGIGETFEKRITLVSNERENRTFAASTIQWWLMQPKEAQKSLYEGHLSPLRQSLIDLRRWIQSLNPTPYRLWAKDPDFDNSILAHAFEALGEPWIFKYYETRSVRTVVELAWPDGNAPSMPAGKHIAVEDAIWQAKLVQGAIKEIYR